MKKILGISLVAMMAVTAARADIASKAYVTVDQSKEYTNFDKEDTPGVQLEKLDTAVTNAATVADGAQTAEEVTSAINTALANSGNAYQTASDVSTTLGSYYTKTAADGKFVEAGTAIEATSTENYLVKYDAQGLVTGGVAAGAAAKKDVDTDFTNTSSSNLPTTAAVATYVGSQAAASNFVENSIESTSTTKAPSGQAVSTALAAKQDIVIGATNGNDENKILVVNNGGEISKSSTVLGTAAGGTIESTGVSSNTTTLPTTAQVKTYVDTKVADGAVNSISLESGTNDGTVKLTVDGTATDNIAITGLGSAAYTEASAYDAAGSATNAVNGLSYTGATGGNVITQVTQTNGTISATMGTVLNTVNSATGGGNVVSSIAVNSTNANQLDVTTIKAIPVPTATNEAGTLVLTAVSDGEGGYTYAWESITRAN